MKTLLAKLLGISKQLLEWIVKIAAAQAADSLSRLLPIAAGIVGELALSNGLGNAEKRAKAFDRLQNAAAQEGIRAGTSALNLAVEMAVAELKARTVK